MWVGARPAFVPKPIRANTKMSFAASGFKFLAFAIMLENSIEASPSPRVLNVAEYKRTVA